MPTLKEIALQPSDRATLIGASGCGKSTLASYLLRQWQAPNRRLLVADTKPRWRATKAVTGRSIRSRYRNYVPGDVLDGVVCDDLKHWDLVWDPQLNPTQTVILQNTELDEQANVLWQVKAIERFFATQKPSKKSLLYVDEGMDFYGPSGTSRYGNAIQRCYRAGREKGLATLLGTQRPKCINLQTLTEANVLYLFRLQYSGDTKRLVEMGLPEGTQSPEDDHVFKYVRNGKLYPKPLTLKVGK